MDPNDDFIKLRSPTMHTFLKKSLSSIGICTVNPNLGLREAKSFTGAIEELKINTIRETNNHRENIHSHEQMYMAAEPFATQINEKGYVTREVMSNQIFVVKDEMLTYRGKRYSLNDIATKWKKDCRMWLWKSNKQKKNRSLGELREKFQNTKL